MDRNRLGFCHLRDDVSSLSARRAWIEMRKITITVDEGTSLSARRAWIEIHNGGISRLLAWSLSARRAWIEISYAHRSQCSDWSLSARRAWIEMAVWAVEHAYQLVVALRKESVDRNACIP